MIGYDAMSVYGSPFYYAQQMFYKNVGNGVLASEISGVVEITLSGKPEDTNSITDPAK